MDMRIDKRYKITSWPRLFISVATVFVLALTTLHGGAKKTKNEVFGAIGKVVGAMFDQQYRARDYNVHSHFMEPEMLVELRELIDNEYTNLINVIETSQEMGLDANSKEIDRQYKMFIKDNNGILHSISRRPFELREGLAQQSLEFLGKLYVLQIDELKQHRSIMTPGSIEESKVTEQIINISLKAGAVEVALTRGEIPSREELGLPSRNVAHGK